MSKLEENKYKWRNKHEYEPIINYDCIDSRIKALDEIFKYAHIGIWIWENYDKRN